MPYDVLLASIADFGYFVAHARGTVGKCGDGAVKKSDYIDAAISKQGVVVFGRDKGFRRRILMYWSLIFVGGGLLFLIMSPASLAQSFGITAILMIVIFGIFEAVYHWSKSKRIEVDFDLNVVRLYGFRYPYGFWDIGPKKLVELKFDDFLYIERTWSKIDSVIVHTKQSKFYVMETLERYSQLVSLLGDFGDTGEHEIEKRKKTKMIEHVLICAGAGVAAFAIVGFLGYLLGWI